VDMNYPGDGNTHQGVVMRHSTSSKFVSATLDSYQGSTRTNYITFSRVAPVAGGTGIQVPAPSDLQAGISVFYTIRLQVAASGEWQIWFWETGGSPLSAPYMTGQDSTLATGGELDTGKVGLIDWNDGSTTSRLYDSFSADTLVEGTFGIQGLDFELVPIEFSSGKIATLNVYEALGSDKPNAVFENPAVAPVYGTDYVVGDTVRMRAKYNGVSRLNGTVRVYGVELVIDDEGKEQITPTLIAE